MQHWQQLCKRSKQKVVMSDSFIHVNLLIKGIVFTILLRVGAVKNIDSETLFD